MYLRITLLSLAALLAAACGSGPAPEEQAPAAPAIRPAAELSVSEVVGIATIQPLGEILPLNPEAAGNVAAVYAGAGDTVRKSAPILELDHRIEDRQVAQAESKIATQQAYIQSLQASLKSLIVKRDQAKTTYDRNAAMLAGGAQTQQAADDSKAAYESLARDVEASEAGLRQQEKRLAELRADLAYYQALRDQKYLRAPVTGTLLSMDAKLGSYVAAAEQVGELAPAGGLMAVTEVDELFAGRVRIGDRAWLRPQGGSDTLASGRVIYAAPSLKKKSLFSDAAANLEDRRVREVKVQLDGASLLIGSRLECVISIQ
ncbi:MAG: HlyD family efflux transporter periplasmic adaptor subunit [Bacteroidia bacterium]|nr:HlyD family efflux transporter periplasmic adaptor subunit [Bacteroidia bacterium]